MISRAVLPLAMLITNGLAQAPDVVIRTDTREVLLDVVVRDAHGHLVTNLKPEEISVYEDGVRQDVRSFRLVSGTEVRVEDLREAAESEETAVSTPAPQSTARPAVNPLRTVNIVCLILNDLTTETRAFAFESARKFVDNELRPNTFIGVFSLDSSGLRPVYPFSNNRERLLKAVELAAVNQLRSINLSSAAILNGLSMSMIGSVAPGGASAAGTADGSSPQNPLGTRGDMGLATNGALREIDALKALVRQLAQMPLRKTVLLLSTGLTRPPDQLEYWESLIRAATEGGVTFYAVDVHAMDPSYDPTAASTALLKTSAILSAQQGPATLQVSGSTSGPSGSHGPLSAGQIAQAQQNRGPSGSPTAAMMEMAHEDDYVKFAVSSANTQEAIRELAERTGGFLIANTNNVDHLLAHVMEEVDTHYEISYPPTSHHDDGHFRKIEVRLARAGLRADTRSGYFAVPGSSTHPLSPEEMAGLRALDTQPRPHAFNFLSRAYRFRDSNGATQYAIAFEMPISDLTAMPEGDVHKHRFHASLLAVVKNADGEIVDRLSKDVPSEVSDDHLAGVQVEFMTYQHAVNLPPGRYTVETAVVDHEGKRASTGLVQIDNRPDRGIGLSDLALVRKLENLGTPLDTADPFQYTGKRVLPFVTPNLFAGYRPFVFCKIYPEPGNAAKPAVRVRLLKDGRAIATLRPQIAAPDDSGAIPMVLQLTPNPGNYEVIATVTQGKSSVERSLKYNLAAARPLQAY